MQPLARIAAFLGLREVVKEEALKQSEVERARAESLVDTAEAELAKLMYDLDQCRPAQQRPRLQAAE